MKNDPILLRAYAEAHCGCPAEDWLLPALGIEVMVHFEDGHADCAIDTGDYWEDDASLPCASIEEGRAAALRWAHETAAKHGWLA